jgi:hypothetical protein
MSCAPPVPELDAAASVRVTLTGYTLAQLPGWHPRSAVQLPVPVGVVSPSTGIVTVVTPWAVVLNPVSAIEGDRAVTDPRLRPLRVSSKPERVVRGWYTVNESFSAPRGALLRMLSPMVRSWLGALGPTHGDWLTSVRWSEPRAAAAEAAPTVVPGRKPARRVTVYTVAAAALSRVAPTRRGIRREDSGAHVSGVRSPPRAGAMLASVRSTSASQPRAAEAFTTAHIAAARRGGPGPL